MSLFNPSRDEARQFFFSTWRKRHDSQPLEPLEDMAWQVIAGHPEYHGVLDAPEKHLARDYFPEMGETNPFLHLSLHLAVLEQLSIDQPAGIVLAYRELLHRHGEAHAAQHVLMDCLAETVWQAQRDRRPADGAAYLECLRRRGSGNAARP